ncbi:sensor histidine kinase [Paenibacillus glucanolyticus]|jgi:two-component system sensor histidine kinase YesM|uniref:sensor histidine kinase n=1 Tax=Paenibacillus TaxID=44249 RepID=UPI0003E1E2D1|nr:MULTISPECIES: sensor histidine kinase [Paenibacillus]ANA80936.1 histidine kinase [Paenibacillus glucanolyticus]AVV54992.1 sensor histidine kinase [Paenibacillus glucanolyticus]ETT40651.1 integral membrane sensor signal transduction histidine kinase [Paenibacillus sp. FSL R5-808]MPY15282.1 sensor histidine kinase [Paenibacillus glucanolyticus]
MRGYHRLHSIVIQLFLFFFIGTTLPVLIMGFLSYNKSASIVEEQVSKVASLTITQVSDKLNMFFKKLDDSSMMVLNSKVVHGILEDQDMSKYDLTLKVKEGKDLLTSIMINSPEILDVYVFDVLRNNSVLSADSLMSIPDQWDSAWYQSILEANGQAVWFGLSDTSYLKQTGMGFPVFGLGRAIRSWDTGEIVGVMFIEIMGDVLIDELNHVQFGDTGYMYVANDENRYFYHPDPSMYGKQSQIKLPTGLTEYNLNNNKTLMIPSRLNNGWHVVGMVPLKELTADSASIRSFTVWIVFGSILAAIGIGYFMTRRIGNPLVQLSRLMRRSEAGDLSVRSKNVGSSEIGQLGRSFNKMIEQIDLLIRRIAAEESEKKKAEIRALRYQINPHFLYNTLNSIRWMAKLNRTNDVDQSVTALVHLLEGSLERNGVFIRLGDELEQLRKYMIIQNYRYDHQIELRIDCPEDLEDIHIPRMLLQPIVENAIFHGIAPLDDTGVIRIRISSQQQDVLVQIEDNGIGIRPERITGLLSHDQDHSKHGMTHIGLRHVHQTVQLYYGSGYGVWVESREHEGTRVTITFAKERGDAYVQSAARG